MREIEGKSKTLECVERWRREVDEGTEREWKRERTQNNAGVNPTKLFSL
jgi:hypothetical protein